MRSRSLLIVHLAALLALCCLARTARPQSIVTEGNLTNFAFLHYYGTGAFTVGDQRVLVIRIPPAITLRSLEEYPWGLRVKLAVAFAIQDFDTFEELDLDKYSVFTIVPGVEFLVPVGHTQTLRPYLDLGVGVDDESKQLALVGGLGLKSEFIYRWRRFRLGLEPELQFSASRSLEGPEHRDSYSELVIRGVARHPFGPRVWQAQPDAGVYGQYSLLFNTLEFESVTGDPARLRNLYEIGAILGFQYPRPKVWLFSVPSISIGYRWGSDFQGLRIAIGGDWVTPVLADW